MEKGQKWKLLNQNWENTHSRPQKSGSLSRCLGLEMQVCVEEHDWPGGPYSLTATSSNKLQFSSCAPALVWEWQLLDMKPARRRLVLAHGQASKII